MSKVAIKGASTGSATFTLEAPATNTDRTLVLPDNAGTLDTLQRAGNVLQVVSVAKTDTFSTTSTSFVDITGLAATITPASSTSKILVIAHVCVGGNWWSSGGTPLRLLRDAVSILPGQFVPLIPNWTGTTAGANSYSGTSDNTAYHFDTVPIVYLDSPSSTSALTYKIQTSTVASTNWINRTTFGNATGTSTLTVMEIAA